MAAARLFGLIACVSLCFSFRRDTFVVGEDLDLVVGPGRRGVSVREPVSLGTCPCFWRWGHLVRWWILALVVLLVRVAISLRGLDMRRGAACSVWFLGCDHGVSPSSGRRPGP